MQIFFVRICNNLHTTKQFSIDNSIDNSIDSFKVLNFWKALETFWNANEPHSFQITLSTTNCFEEHLKTLDRV